MNGPRSLPEPYLWQEGVEIDDAGEPLHDERCQTSDHHPGVAVSDQNDVAQVLIEEQCADVLNVRLQVDGWRKEVLSLAFKRSLIETGLCAGGEHSLCGC